MTAAIPAAAERVAAGRLAGPAATAGVTPRVKKAPAKPASAPTEESSRTSASRSSNVPRGYGRGARTRRLGPRSSRPTQPHVRVLVAEWLLAVILIVVTVPSEKGGKGYPQTMSTIMLRLTGLTGIFFALTLIGTVQRAAKFSIWFGFIIDLGIIYHATTAGSTKALAAVFTGKSILSESGGATLAADFTDKSDPPQPTPYTFQNNVPAGVSPVPQSGGASLSPNYPGGATGTIPTPGIPGA